MAGSASKTTAVASLLALEAGNGGSGSLALWAAAATGAGSFAAQYGLGVLSDRWGARPVLLCLSGVLALALAALAVLPTALIPLAALVGGAGGGLYTVAVIAAVQARRGGSGSAGTISAMALLYTLGTMAAPVLSGGAIAAVGPVGLVSGMALASAALALGLWLARG